MTILRVGIVGCGEVTQIIHLPTLYHLHDQFQVTALCDISPSVLDGVAQTWRVPKRYADYRELIEQNDVDVVLVANPNAHHMAVTLAALSAGKHVLVEKPMCMNLREADEVIAASAQRPDLVVQVAYMRRYAPAFELACRLLPDLGDIRLARVRDVLGYNSLIISRTSRVLRGNDIPADILAEGKRLQESAIREAIGEAEPAVGSAYGLLLGLSTHDISAMRELLGMPQRVLHATQRQGGSYMTAVFDYGGYVCQFETGVDNIPRFDAHLEVYGRDRVMRVQYDTPYVRNLPIRLLITETNNQGGVVERVEHPAWGDPFVAEWEAFYDNICHQRLPKSSAADFRQDLELFNEMIALMRDSC